MSNHIDIELNPGSGVAVFLERRPASPRPGTRRSIPCPAIGFCPSPRSRPPPSPSAPAAGRVRQRPVRHRRGPGRCRTGPGRPGRGRPGAPVAGSHAGGQGRIRSRHHPHRRRGIHPVPLRQGQGEADAHHELRRRLRHQVAAGHRRPQGQADAGGSGQVGRRHGPAARRHQPADRRWLAGVPVRRGHRAGGDRGAGRQRDLVRDHPGRQEGRRHRRRHGRWERLCGAAADGSGADGAAGSDGANGSSSTGSDGADADGAAGSAVGGGY